MPDTRLLFRIESRIAESVILDLSRSGIRHDSGAAGAAWGWWKMFEKKMLDLSISLPLIRRIGRAQVDAVETIPAARLRT